MNLYSNEDLFKQQYFFPNSMLQDIDQGDISLFPPSKKSPLTHYWDREKMKARASLSTLNNQNILFNTEPNFSKPKNPKNLIKFPDSYSEVFTKSTNVNNYFKRVETCFFAAQNRCGRRNKRDIINMANNINNNNNNNSNNNNDNNNNNSNNSDNYVNSSNIFNQMNNIMSEASNDVMNASIYDTLFNSNFNKNTNSALKGHLKNTIFKNSLYSSSNVSGGNTNNVNNTNNNDILNNIDIDSIIDSSISNNNYDGNFDTNSVYFFNAYRYFHTENNKNNNSPKFDIFLAKVREKMSNINAIPSFPKSSTDVINEVFSPWFAFYSINYDPGSCIEEYSTLMFKEKNPVFLACLYANRAILYLAHHLNKRAQEDCSYSIKYDPSQSLPYYILGVIYLWEKKELNAITVWRSALKHTFYNNFTLIMKHLIQDHNIRHYLFSLSDNPKKFVEFTKNYIPSAIYSSDDVQIGYKKLNDGDYESAIAHLNNVLQVQPHNTSALCGHAVASCLNGEMNQAMTDYLILMHNKKLKPKDLKFFGYNFACLNFDASSVSSFSTAIESNPTDYESILQRSELQFNRSHFKMALKDLMSLPERMRTDPVLVQTAQCYVLMGQLQKAIDTLRCISPSFEKDCLYYCHFLVSRDQGDSNEAKKYIEKTVKANPCFDYSKIAGDYLYSIAEFSKAIVYYLVALEEDPLSAEVKRSLAYSYVQHGDEISGLKILKKLGNAALSNGSNTGPIKHLDQWVQEINGLSFSLFNTSNIDRFDPFEPMLKTDNIDYRYVLHLMAMIDKPFYNCVRNKIVDLGKGKIPFNLSKFEPTESEIEIMKAADRLGEKCYPKTYEVQKNKRLIRALGLGVLYVAYFMNKEKFTPEKKIRHWSITVDVIRALLQIADFKVDIQWVSKDIDGTNVDSRFAPQYYIQMGTRMPPRFQFISKTVFNRLSIAAAEMMKPRTFTNHEMSKMNNAKNLYRVVQKDFSTLSYLRIEEGDKVQAPAISLRFLGAIGYEVYITPTISEKYRKRIYSQIQHHWINTVANMPLLHVSSMMLLLWLIQPLSHYNNELGHVFMHGYFLAIYDSEVERLDNGYETFISHMAEPDDEKLKADVFERLTNKVPTTVKPETISFWSQMPTLRKMMQLIGTDI